ncbi:MAG: DUF3800 domain-containing protein [Elusimicrobiota bacterium]
MLVFIDESGDTGLKMAEGSSEFFVVALVIFEDYEKANACDQRIGLLKEELGLHPKDEFKFSKLSRDKREAFFRAVVPYPFCYFGITIQKKKLRGEGFKFKESFYKCVCKYVFQNAGTHLRDAIVVIDGSGSREFKRQLGNYLRRNTDDGAIRNVKMQSSHNNYLIQLADMVVGAIHRSFANNKPDKEVYRDLIRRKEKNVQLWPK